MLRLAPWHAPDTCARVPPFTASCRPLACSAPYFRTPWIRPSTHPAPSDLALYLSMARSPLLKTHSLKPARRTRQRLTSHDFIESARRSIPALVPGASRRALPIKIWRDPAGSASQVPGTRFGLLPQSRNSNAMIVSGSKGLRFSCTLGTPEPDFEPATPKSNLSPSGP
jgi:hypothetical protein